MTPSSRGGQVQQQAVAEPPPAGPTTPLDVRVTADSALVDGARVTAAPGEEIQRAVLKHLHALAHSSGRTVLALVHDERIGYVVPLQVAPDGSSSFTGDPVRARRGGPRPEASPATEAVPGRTPVPEAQRPPAPTGGFGPPPAMAGPSSTTEPSGARPPARPVHSPYAARPDQPRPDAPNPYLQPTAPPRPPREPGSGPLPEAGPRPGRAPHAAAGPATVPHPHHEADSAPAGHTPPRGFDAVAEAVLDDAPGIAGGPLAEPMARISEAVRSGQVTAAAELAEQALTAAALHAEHPDTLRLRELAAYIAYLAGDGARALALSLDLARIHHGRNDAEAAYGNVQSAAMAWRAVRDPQEGLRLGRELIDVWTELASGGGPAATDRERLESAHARMARLAARAGLG